MSTQTQIPFPVLFSDTRYVSAAEISYYRRRAHALREQAIDSGLRKLADNLARTIRALSQAGQVRLAAAE